MTTAYLNGRFLPLDEARISPMDRGFLFGDGIYEVIPSYDRNMVGFERHMVRLASGLAAIAINNPFSVEQWQSMLRELLHANPWSDAAVYLQVTRGTAPVRNHRYPEHCEPTVFAYPFAISPRNPGDAKTVTRYSAVTGTDQRWQRCHIKSVALLGNVLHMMEGADRGADEILLFNDADELTEAAACNVFVVINGQVLTPPLDQQKLPGITRNMLIDILRTHGDIPFIERVVTREEVCSADEIWLTSSTKEVVPVTQLDGRMVGDGEPGPFWQKAQRLFDRYRFSV